jgi:polyhydroxyalkanoate synthase
MCKHKDHKNKRDEDLMSGTEENATHGDKPKAGFNPDAAEAYVVRDPHQLALNVAKALENLGKAASEWLAPRERGDIEEATVTPVTDMVRTLSDVAEYWMAEPKRSLEAQTHLLSSYFDIWSRSLSQFSGEGAPEPEQSPTPRKHKRFSDEGWQTNPFFDFLQQAYFATAGWADKMVLEAEGLDEHTRHKAAFYIRQITEALSPANFPFTNPQVYRETVASSGANLVKGMAMFAEDIAAVKGNLKLRQTDYSQFIIGKNIAVTPGKIIARSDICEVIQYAPSTPTVLKRPLLIVPPWINKYYVLDLNPKKSFVKWCVDQGHTVFMISWVNPDSRHADKDWDAYIREGIDFALQAVETATGEKQINAIGYCVGGTLLAATLALHAQKEDSLVSSVTFLAAQTDFTHAGDLKVFVDNNQVTALEQHMKLTGYLDGALMATAFNMLRASELIWPYVVDNYLRGEPPLPFDLLYWNSDSTRVSAANHSFYLRNCYLDNNLARDRMIIAGKTLKLKDITIPVYSLAMREDHIAPAKSVFTGASLFGGPVEFVLSGSGHIAGVVNPPDSGKYQFWTGGDASGDLEQWQITATAKKGSWWQHWQAWIEDRDNSRIPARSPADGTVDGTADAPGTYVLT